MRQRFFPQTLIVSLFLILALTVPTYAQGLYIPITADNAAQITQIQRIGSGVPRQMTFSPDGSRLAVATTLGIWQVDLSVGARHASPDPLEGQGGAESVTFSPDGSMIASGGEDNSVMVFDASTGETVVRLENHIYPVSAVAWSDDGKWIASGDWSGVVRIWDTSNWSEYRVLAMTEKIASLSFYPTMTELTASDDNPSKCSTWDITNGSVLSPLPCPSSGIQFITNFLAVSQGDHHADHSTDTGQIKIWDKDTLIATLDGFYGEPGGVFFTPDGRVGASPLQSPYLWSLEGQPSDAPLPVLSPDGSILATFGNDGVIHLKDAKTGNDIAALHGHIRAVTDVAFSPDSRLLVSSSNDGTIQVWDATVTQDSGSLVTLTGHNGGVSSVAFNADGTLIASTGYDGTVRLWGIRSQ